ncbi:MAG: hypothetical protein ACYTF0_03230, partial [Planctomycetota bacterium]
MSTDQSDDLFITELLEAGIDHQALTTCDARILAYLGMLHSQLHEALGDNQTLRQQLATATSDLTRIRGQRNALRL